MYSDPDSDQAQNLNADPDSVLRIQVVILRGKFEICFKMILNFFILVLAAAPSFIVQIQFS